MVIDPNGSIKYYELRISIPEYQLSGKIFINAHVDYR
jgi:hypothetical protein